MIETKNIKISVLVPCQNITTKLFCLDSILNQTYTNLEIILLNDYSNDNTLEILNSYKLEDNRIKVIDLRDYNNHIGLGYNRNFLIEQSSGEYFTFVDDDDYLRPRAIEMMVKELAKNDYDIVAGTYQPRLVLSTKHKILLSCPKIPTTRHKILNSRDYYFYHYAFSWGSLVKREYYMKITNKYKISYLGNTFEDIRFNYLLYLDPFCKFKFINVKLLNYQVRSNSIVSSTNSLLTKTQNHVNSLIEVLENVEKFNLLNRQEIAELCKVFYMNAACFISSTTYLKYKKISPYSLFSSIKQIEKIGKKCNYLFLDEKNISFLTKIFLKRYKKLKKMMISESNIYK